jgi:hypothetical protein
MSAEVMHSLSALSASLPGLTQQSMMSRKVPILTD